MSDNITPVDSDVCAVTFDKKEYAIVGDAVFAQSVVGVPDWMQELVGDLVNTSVADTYNAMTGFNYNLYNAMLALQVTENIYEQVINSKITDQEAFVQAVETLNSTVQNSQAEIVGIKQTYATKDFAMTTAAQTLEASLNGGAIKSSLGQLASTMTNQYGTMAQRMDVLESTFDDLEAGVEGYANATSKLETFVGKNAPGTNAPVIASSKFYQDLNVYLEGTNYTTGGTNTLVNQVTAAATGVESKFAYNSSLKLNGATYDSGFGLATSLTPGSGIPVGSSEFWINADKFKLTTTGYNGVKYSPFSVNGTDGTITFNGKVSFNSVTNVPNYVLPQDVASAVNNNTTTIDGRKITTGSISANKIKTNEIVLGDSNVHISAQGMYIRDASGRLRVKIGNLDYVPVRMMNDPVTGEYIPVATGNARYANKVVWIKIPKSTRILVRMVAGAKYSGSGWFGYYAYYYLSSDYATSLMGRTLDAELNNITDRNYVVKDALGLSSSFNITDAIEYSSQTIYGGSNSFTATTGSYLELCQDFYLTVALGRFGERDYVANKSMVTIAMTPKEDMYFVKEVYGSTPFGDGTW